MREHVKVSYPIPFYTQQVDFNDVNLQGFKSKQEAEHWQGRGCGIASTKMVIDGFQIYRGLRPSEAYGESVHLCHFGLIHNGNKNITYTFICWIVELALPIS